MTPAGRGQSQTASSANHGQQKTDKNKNGKNASKQDKNKTITHNPPGQKLKQDVDCEVSFDVSDSASKQNSIMKDLQDKIVQMEIAFNAKIEALTQVIETKDKVLSKLNQQVGFLKSEVNNLKASSDFLSQETSDLKTQNENLESNYQQDINALREKTVDLEDRGRRNNLVFFGIEEALANETENCEGLVLTKVLVGSGVINEREINGEIFDRAHRLGPKKDGQGRPRPIIARFTHYKDKEAILRQSYKLKNTRYGIAEDFSKPTLQIRNELIAKGKAIRDQHDFVKGFKLKFTRLSLKYENPDNKNIFYRSFSLSDIQSNPNWYLPKFRNQPNTL